MPVMRTLEGISPRFFILRARAESCTNVMLSRSPRVEGPGEKAEEERVEGAEATDGVGGTATEGEKNGL